MIPSQELCGRCKREKVNGKCPACGRPKEKLEDWETYWNEKFRKETKEALILNGYKENSAIVEGMSNTTWDTVVLSKYREGYADIEIRVILELSNDLWDRFLVEEEKFSGTIHEGRSLSEAWWNAHSRTALKDKEFNTQLYRLNMANRFGWSTEKNQTDITSKGEKLEGIAVSFKDIPKDDSEPGTTS